MKIYYFLPLNNLFLLKITVLETFEITKGI